MSAHTALSRDDVDTSTTEQNKWTCPCCCFLRRFSWLQRRTLIHVESVLQPEAAPVLELVAEQESIDKVVRPLAQKVLYLEHLWSWVSSWHYLLYLIGQLQHTSVALLQKKWHQHPVFKRYPVCCWPAPITLGGKRHRSGDPRLLIVARNCVVGSSLACRPSWILSV